MILYSSNAIDFRYAVDNNSITDKIEGAFIHAFGKRPATGEKRAWNNSMQFMEKIVRNSQVADDCGILIEFTIPTSSKRVDFIISGRNQRDENNFVIVELKQWDDAEATDREDVVIAYVGGRERDMAHPSYQAWSYKQMLDDMNTAIQSNSIHSLSCSYLHNYKEKVPEPLTFPQYNKIVSRTPIYLVCLGTAEPVESYGLLSRKAKIRSVVYIPHKVLSLIMLALPMMAEITPCTMLNKAIMSCRP